MRSINIEIHEGGWLVTTITDKKQVTKVFSIYRQLMVFVEGFLA